MHPRVYVTSWTHVSTCSRVIRVTRAYVLSEHLKLRKLLCFKKCFKSLLGLCLFLFKYDTDPCTILTFLRAVFTRAYVLTCTHILLVFVHARITCLRARTRLVNRFSCLNKQNALYLQYVSFICTENNGLQIL